jgi:methyl-accepting chemotaxis protein
MAAKEIKELINDSVVKVKSGTELVNESGTTLSEIVMSVKKVGDIVSEIAAASQKQSAGIDQVNQAVTSMDEVTQQNAALAEETSAAAASMSDKAREMHQIMNIFKVNENNSDRLLLKENTVTSKVSIESPYENNSNKTTQNFTGSKEEIIKIKQIKTQADESDEWEKF